jgi:hypothetical protein
LVPPGDTLKEDEESGFEPTRIREGDPISPPGRKISVAPSKPAPRAVIPKITVPPVFVPPIATTVDPQRDEEPIAASSSASEDPFGGNTEKWIAGKIDGKALSWSDDDAARRAVETRNVVKNAGSSPAPAVVPKPSAVAVRTTSQPSAPPPTLHQPPPVSPFAPHLENDAHAMMIPRPPRAQKGSVIAAFVALAVGIGTLAGAVIYPTLFAPELSIATTPPGAAVSINGARLAGATPIELVVDPNAEQHIEIALEGYQTVVRDIAAIERGQRYAINVALEHLQPELRIAPSGGRVFLNGMEIGSGGIVRLRGIDPNGVVEVRVEAPGFQPYKNQWSRGSQIPAIVDVELKRL